MIGGSQTVTLISEADGALDRKNIPAKVPTPTSVTGCVLVPTGAKEKITNVDYAVNTFTLYAPPFPAVLDLKPSDLVTDASGSEYHVVGTNIFPNFNGTTHHVEVFLWQPSGLNEPPSTAY